MSASQHAADNALLSSYAWPTARLGEALIALSHEAGFAPHSVNLGAPEHGEARVPIAELGRWLEQSVTLLGLDVEIGEPTYRGLPEALRGAPLLLPVPVDVGFRWLLITKQHARRTTVLAPDGLLHVFASDVVLQLTREPLERGVEGELRAMLELSPLGAAARERAERALISERLADTRVGLLFRLRPGPAVSFWHALRATGFFGQVAATLGMHVVVFACALTSMWTIGRMALLGRMDSGWFAAWCLLLVSQLPLSRFAGLLQGKLEMSFGFQLRRRILRGLVQLRADDVRGEGAGHLLGRLLEAQVTESQALSAVLGGAGAALECIVMLVLLAVVPAGRGAAALYLLWLAAGALFVKPWAAAHTRWTRARLSLTHDFVEVATGHRSRLVFQTKDQWHEREDRALSTYYEASRHADRWDARYAALWPRGALVLGVLGVAPAVLRGDFPAQLAVALFGVLLFHRALQRVAGGLRGGIEAGVALQLLAPVLTAAARAEHAGTPIGGLLLSSAAANDSVPVVDAHELGFRYRPDREPILAGCTLRIMPGDRLMLTGASGGGKSTLAAILAGLRDPHSGVLLHRGLDRATLGRKEWSRRVSLAPQFHENHIFSNTFAFNILMGRRWPPTPEDLVAAQGVCEALGLTPLLERMPGGLAQLLGESGWQLSHGERSRVFIARALLQDPQLLILDESLASLDPETHTRVLEAVVARARSVMIVAHP